VSRRKPEKVLPEQIDLFWSVPNCTKDGIEYSLSSYFVHSITGEIWSCYSGRFLVPCKGTQGYMKVSLVSDQGKVIFSYQHRVVLAAKIKNWDWEQVHHIVRNTGLNIPENLEPRTRKEQFDEETRRNQSLSKQGSKSYLAKLNESQVFEIKLAALDAGDIVIFKKEMANKFRVHPMTIHAMLTGKTWTIYL
jgi:hypothetical protein